ncbi:MAG: primosomal protein N' [Parachlamydiales bacterium]|nr:primosomal protein N' [Parachlamydiales bacterium]
MSKKYASIVLETNIEKPLDYLVPSELIDEIKEGMLVEVPLRNSYKKGYIVSLKDHTDIGKVLPIKRIAKNEVLTEDLFKLAIFMQRYYVSSMSKVLRCMIPTSVRKEINIKSLTYLYSNKSKKDLLKILNTLMKKNPSQAKALEYFLKEKNGIFLKELIKTAKISKAPIDSLIAKNIFKTKKLIQDEIDFLSTCEFFKSKPKVLNDEQKASFEKIKNSIKNEKFETHLLYGVTGSGKTEIFLQAIEETLKQEKCALMLVPEISLTPQTIERFKKRFDEHIAVIHHKKSSGEKSKAFDDIISGKAKIVIGARSAIFAPIKNLGLIIIDEEHDNSYKQSEESPTYNAKHLAIVRASYLNATVVLASATPSIESFYNAKNKKYVLSTLTKRANNANLPKITIVDMKIEREKSKSFFSFTLLNAIEKRLEKGEQVILFLNRRGYHTSVSCLNCSYTFKCPHCDISLTFHKNEQYMACHLCGYLTKYIKTCPDCKKNDFIKFKGVGTENVEASIRNIFPKAKTIRIDRDTTIKKTSHETLLKQFRSAKADILIGTQMIVKGLHFPNVTLVGVLNTDSALNIPDFRSSENVFSLLTQVSGRAGRDSLSGEVIIQTYMPDSEIINLAKNQDYLSFFDMEIQNRKLFLYPPFSNILKIVFTSKDEDLAKKTGSEFRQKVIENLTSDFTIHPIIPSGRAKVKDFYRFQFLIRAKNILPALKEINILKNQFKTSSKVSIFIDVDPVNTYF